MGLADRAVRSVFGFGVINTFEYGLSFLVQVLFARLLTPEIFGIVALGATLRTFTTLVHRWGIPQALMQENVEYPHRFSTIFWINLVFTILLLIVTGFGAPILYLYFQDIVVDVFFVLLLANAVKNVTVPFQAAIQREFALSKLGVIDLAALVFGSTVGIWLALEGYGVWSLAVYYALRNSLAGIGHLVASPLYPAMTFSRRTARWFYGFAVGMVKSRVLLSVESEGDDYLVGSLGGTGLLGFYNLGWRLATAFHSVIHPAIREGIMPTFAKLKNTTEKSREGIEFLVRMQLSVVIPAYVFAGIAAPTLITTVFGNQWTGAVPVFRVLAIAGILFPLLATGRQVYYSWGQPDTVFRIQGVYVVVMVVGLLFLIPFAGAVGAAIAVDLSLLIGCILTYRALVRDVNLSIIRLFAPRLGAGTAALVAGIATKRLLLPRSSILIETALLGSIVAVVFLVAIYSLASSEVIEDLSVLNQAILSD